MANTPVAIDNDLPAGHAHDRTASEPWRLVAVSLGAALVQGLCVIAILVNSVKVGLGIGSVAAAAGAAPFFHSDPVRLPLMVLAALGATFTLYVLWNGWRLRNRPEAQWRRRPLTNRQRWSIGIALSTSLLSWFLIIVELLTHRMFHPY